MEFRELTYLAIACRIAVAVFLGGIIGMERGLKNRPAGLRTYMLVCVGSCLIMITNQYVFQAFGTGDPVRMGAQVVSGIGFLGAGTIVVTRRNQIKGLTTSAALWACGVLGLTAGAGLFTLTLVGFILLMISLSWMPTFERDLKNRSNFFEVHLELTNSQYLQDFITTIRRLGLSIDDIELNPAYANSGLSVYSISLSIRSDELKQYKTHAEIIEALSSLEYVYHIEEMVS